MKTEPKYSEGQYVKIICKSYFNGVIGLIKETDNIGDLMVYFIEIDKDYSTWFAENKLEDVQP